MSDHLDRLRAALEAGPTPGPWGHGYWAGQCNEHERGKHPGEPQCKFAFTLAHDAGDDDLVFDNPHRIVSLSEPVTVTGNYDYEDGGVIGLADAAYIAAADPSTIRELLSERDALAAVAEAMVALLRERMDGQEWSHDHCDETSDGTHRLDYDWWQEDAAKASAAYDSTTETPPATPEALDPPAQASRSTAAYDRAVSKP